MIALCVFLSLILVIPKKVYATLYLNDGQTHNIDSEIQDHIEVYDNAASGNFTTVNFLPNAVLDWDFHAYENSRINISGGIMTKTFYTFNNSRATFSEGTIGGICVNGDSRIEISGGSITANLRADDSAQIIFSGGSIGNDILAGELPTDNSTITFVGSDFTINGQSVAYGQYFHGDYADGRLSGKLVGGDTVDNDFYIVGGASIILVPEPATLLLLGLGAIIIKNRKY